MERRNVERALRAVTVLVPALLAVACADRMDIEPARAVDPTTTVDPASGTTRTRYEVGVDGTSDVAPVSFHRFFPDRLSVHPGDTVVFRRPDNGEPHTVTFATEPPRQDAVPGEKFFEGGFGNPPRTDASMACVLPTGTPPSDGCEPSQRESVPFDGTQTWFNSGGMLGEEEFVVELSDDIAPGSYLFICLIHTSTMRTTIDVVPPDEAADDPAEVRRRAEEAEARERAWAQRVVDRPLNLAEGRVTAARPDPTFASWVNTFSPEDVEIPVGGTVTWTLRGMHTISFNAPESARPFFLRAPDGSNEQNPEAVEPRGDPGAWDGTGMLNSGLRQGVFPPAEFSVTFTTPGTYPYRCLIHFDMDGKVTVRG